MTTTKQTRRPDRANNGQFNTIANILADVNAVRPCSRQTLYLYFDALGIQPIGARQRPQRYPSDAALRILKRMEGAGKIVSLAQLRAERKRRAA